MQRVCVPAGRALRLLLPRLQQRVPAARIVSKPGKEELTAMEQVTGLAVLTACMLIPSGWVLAHLEPHRRRMKGP
ncbi:cytochrome c oxidase subunit 8B, mitochondrial [Pristis pectinata]|uniref:cytochrome c oxidase subunit 8B, mitochondrial n=1 Tax=Pristis pectinata TaxID=685728 RepID=UPI00223CA6A0|nr:cytochrome c oxidase subunit 8B, mitochondrial [Pristis pectinata]